MCSTDSVDFQAYELLDVAVVAAAQDGGIVYANELARAILGLSQEQLVGRALEQALGVSSEALQQLGSQGRSCASGQIGRAHVQWRMRRNAAGPITAVGQVAKDEDGRSRELAQPVSSQALKDSESLFRAIFDAAPYACTVMDESGRYVMANAAFEERTGFALAEAVGKNSEELGLLAESAEDLFAKLYRDGRLDREEITTINRLGQKRNNLCSSRLFQLGGKVHAMSVVVDITDRKLAEEALARSERRFRLMVETVNDVIVIVDRTGVIRFVSPACDSVLGYRSEELENTEAITHVHPEDREGAQRILDVLLRGQPTAVLIDFRQQHKDGSWRWMQASGARLLDEPSMSGVVLALRDVTSRKLAEQEIAAWKHRYDLISLAAGQIAYDYDLSGSVVWGGVIRELLGYEPDEMLGGVAQWEERLHPEDRERVMGLLSLAIAGKEKFAAEYRLRRKSGDYLLVEESGYPYLEPSGKLQGYVGVIMDITQRKEAEQLRIRLEESLRQAQKMEAIGRLAGGVAHDFNNLLTVIGGNVSLAVDEESEDERGLFLAESMKAVETASSLTRQLLAFSRKQVIAPEVLNLNDVVRRLKNMLTRLLGENIAVQIVPWPSLGMVRTDLGQMEQVLINLCVNARDAMSEGGKLTIETANVFLDESYCRKHEGVESGEHVMLAVSDNGAGMSPETRARIFEPFFTTKGSGKGTGLGLAMVYGAVKQNGGNIEVYSEIGQGTTFKIYLPCVDDAPQSVSRPKVPSLRYGGETIVLAEDEELVRNLAVRALQKQGFEVFAFPDGEQALTAIRSMHTAVDLLLTDVVMPGMNGRKLAEQAREIFPSIGVLFTSGYTENVVVHHGALDEGIEFLPKPYTPAMLVQRVRDVLDARRNP